MGPKKHLGQHFLTAPAYARRIAEAVPAREGEHVLEIGPGRGALSIHLRERFPGLHLIEVDGDAIGALREKLGEGPYTLHQGDVLGFDFEKAGFPLHVAGNLPYNIGAHIIRKTLLYGSNIGSCTFMLQREVAQRIAASPHNGTYGFLSVFCSFFGTPSLLFTVPPGAFFPRPNVDSAVVRILVDRRPEERLPQQHWEAFFAFVSKGFQQRRKKAVNALSSDPADKNRLEGVFAGLGIPAGARPEDIECREWLELFKLLCVH
jgi:16S rRNA (adenine1518-N6/adenine1519-N6)-dimethyltransferase